MLGIDRLKRRTLNYIIDMALATVFFAVFITGLIKFMHLYRIFGIDRLLLPNYLISVIHDWSGVIMGILVLFHLVLHFKWLVAMTKRYLRRGG